MPQGSSAVRPTNGFYLYLFTEGLAAFQVAPKSYELGTKARATERNCENPSSPGEHQSIKQTYQLVPTYEALRLVSG